MAISDWAPLITAGGVLLGVLLGGVITFVTQRSVSKRSTEMQRSFVIFDRQADAYSSMITALLKHPGTYSIAVAPRSFDFHEAIVSWHAEIKAAYAALYTYADPSFFESFDQRFRQIEAGCVVLAMKTENPPANPQEGHFVKVKNRELEDQVHWLLFELRTAALSRTGIRDKGDSPQSPQAIRR